MSLANCYNFSGAPLSTGLHATIDRLCSLTRSMRQARIQSYVEVRRRRLAED